MFDFCGTDAGNPVAEALSALAAMLMDPLCGGRPHRKLLVLRFGPDIDKWPSRTVAALQISLIIACCMLWRKLFHSLSCYPWLLAPAFDLRRTVLQRRDTIAAFFDASLCRLDVGLSRKLRRLATNIDDFFDSVLGDFLVTLFERVVVTSTQVELQFSRLSIWSNGGGRGPRLGLPGLAAKAATTTFDAAVRRWRRSFSGGCGATNNLARPAWTKRVNAGNRMSALHVYQRSLIGETGGAGAVEAIGTRLGEQRRLAKLNFDLLPASEQAKYRRDASIARSIAKARLSPLNAALAPREEVRGGPLDIATLNAPFPLQPSAVSEHQRGRSFASVVKHWVQPNSAKQLPQDSFPDTAPAVHICNGGVAKPICIRTLA